MRPLTFLALWCAALAAIFALAGSYEIARAFAACALLVGGFRLAYGWICDAQTTIPDTNEPPCCGHHPKPKERE